MCSSRFLTNDQQETVSLLNKLQTVQVENSQLQSNLILRQFDVRHRDLLLDWHYGHSGLARTLIHKQKALIDDNNINHTVELDELYNAYEKELEDMAKHQKTGFLPPISGPKVTDSRIILTVI